MSGTGYVEGCSRAFVPRDENGVLQMECICYCGKAASHNDDPADAEHQCIDCGRRWGRKRAGIPARGRQQ